MKTYASSGVFGIIFSFLLSLAAERAHAQGVITIIGPPNGTRITDCETGQLLGSGYIGAIYWAPDTVTDPNAFAQLGPTMSIINGQLAGGTRTVIGPAPGSPVNLFGAAWESAHGASYEAASQVPGAKVGRSSIVTGVPGGPAVRIPDFQVCPVPEPSIWGFVGLSLFVTAVRGRLLRRG